MLVLQQFILLTESGRMKQSIRAPSKLRKCE